LIYESQLKTSSVSKNNSQSLCCYVKLPRPRHTHLLDCFTASHDWDHIASDSVFGCHCALYVL